MKFRARILQERKKKDHTRTQKHAYSARFPTSSSSSLYIPAFLALFSLPSLSPSLTHSPYAVTHLFTPSPSLPQEHTHPTRTSTSAGLPGCVFLWTWKPDPVYSVPKANPFPSPGLVTAARLPPLPRETQITRRCLRIPSLTSLATLVNGHGAFLLPRRSPFFFHHH